MSNLIDQASLVMIPSGYKEDKIYSQVPTDGSGDIQFTRASDGTRVNSQGLVERVPWNLCTYSEDQTQWGAQNDTTVTANSTTAPNGTTTADTVTPSTANSDHYRGIILGQQVGALTAFIYVKPNGYNFFDWGIWNGSQYIVRATFDLVNLTYTFTNSGTATIESVGNGWLKCGISGTNASLTTMSLYYRSRPTGGTGAFAGNGTSGAFVWGAQLNEGSTAKPYFPTTDRQNVPRLDYSGGCPSLLLEPQRTNVALYSEQFDNAGWSKLGISVTANNTTSPSGCQDADKLVANSGSGTRVVYQGILPAGVSATSVYAKAGEFGGIVIASGLYGAFFNLTTGEYRTQYISAPVSYSITSVGSGWYRCTVTINSPTTDNLYIGPNDNYSNTLGITGNGTDGIYVWGAQLEAGSYPTSYIPTTSSSVTRVADKASKTGISSLIGQTEGTMFWDFQTDNLDLYKRFSVSNGSTSNWIFVGIELGTGVARGYVRDAGVIQADIQGSTDISGSRAKIALAYKANDFVLYANGVQIGTDNGGSVPACNYIDIASQNPATAVNSASTTNQAVLFKTRLTNAELAAITSL